MLYANVGRIKDPLKQDLALGFCKNQNKDISILTESHINNDQMHHIKHHWLGPFFFSPGESHRKIAGPASSVHTDQTDPKERFVFFKVIAFNDRVLCAYVPSG